MIRLLIVFILVGFVGLIIQATLFHGLSFSAVAPDFLVVLVIYLGLRHNTAAGVCGAFFIGVIADFASGEFIGPNAVGGLIVFNIAALVSQKVYAEHPLALVLLTMFCSIVKSLVFVVMVRMYTEVNVLQGHEWTLVIEGLLTALISPLVLGVLHWGIKESVATSSPAGRKMRWSARFR